MVDHDKNCSGCLTAKQHRRNGGGVVTSDLAHCARCGQTHDSGSYLHAVEGKYYCARCANIMARARNEAGVAFALLG